MRRRGFDVINGKLTVDLVDLEATRAEVMAAIALYVIGMLAGLSLVLPKAWRSFVSLRPEMNLLMSVAVVGAALIGDGVNDAPALARASLGIAMGAALLVIANGLRLLKA